MACYGRGPVQQRLEVPFRSGNGAGARPVCWILSTGLILLDIIPDGALKRSAGKDVPSSSSTAQTDARVRDDFVPASRRAVFEKIRDLVSPTMPLANLPDTHKSRWGDELTAEKMKDCVWLRPEAVAQIEFLEWTAGDPLRHSKFVGLRDDKDARQAVKERATES